MREILFRGKRKYSDEWVEGDFYKVDCFYFIIPRNSNGIYSRGKDTLKNVYPCNECIPETIGQYTGLTDKNGVKIFEGDIVKLYLIDGIEIGVIKFNDIMCRFMFFTKEGSYGFDNDCIFEIVGNIYDNPEILKDGVEK